MPSLDYTYLHFPAQHRLLVKVQSILEEICYAFAQKTFPNILAKHGWECAELIELSKWERIFSDQDIYKDLRSSPNLPMSFRPLIVLRNAAVHRERTSPDKIQELLSFSVSVAKTFESGSQISALERLERAAASALAKIESNKIRMDSELDESRQKFAAERDDLAERERTEIEDITEQGQKYRQTASAGLLKVIAELEKVALSPFTEAERDTASEGGANISPGHELHSTEDLYSASDEQERSVGDLGSDAGVDRL